MIRDDYDIYDPCFRIPRDEVYKKYYGGIWFKAKPKIKFKGFNDKNFKYFKKN